MLQLRVASARFILEPLQIRLPAASGARYAHPARHLVGSSVPRIPTVILRVAATKRPFLACRDPNPRVWVPTPFSSAKMATRISPTVNLLQETPPQAPGYRGGEIVTVFRLSL
jgi:hypothetical protein